MTSRRGLPPAAGGREGPDRARHHRRGLSNGRREPDKLAQAGPRCHRSVARRPPTVTRFAPSPTGYLHLGHVRSALEGWRAARADHGRFLLRIEDIDRTRCREEYAAAILEDLAWLGLDWDGPVRRQSEHFAEYRGALDRVEARACSTRAFAPGARSGRRSPRAGGAPQGAGGAVYPGSCRRLPAQEVAAGLVRAVTSPCGWMSRALAR